ncbi:MAG: LysR family transcriptional regulator [Eubacterium sp.]|nr:LysR family transcriptional regulator [Eubacterium sp.]
MNTRDMLYFTEIYKKKSITSAAESLYVLPQALSKAVQKMEQDLGVPLLVRSSKGVTITEYGEIFYESARKITASYADMVNSLNDLKKQEKGFLRMASAFGILRLLSPEFIHAFTEKYQEIHLDYMEFPDIYTEENVKNRKYDVGLVPYIKEDPDLEYIPLFSREIYFVVNEKSQFYNEKEISVRDMSKEPVIIENSNFLIHHIMLETCRREGVNLDIYFNTSGFSLCYKLCKEHEGNTVSMDFIFHDMAGDNRELRMIPFVENPMWKVAAVKRKDMPLTKNIRAFLAFAKEWCRTL